MAATTDDILNQVRGLEELGDQVSFLQLGRMRYMVTPVGQDISISEELKAYVQTQVNGIKDQLSNVLEEAIDEQMQRQLTHINRMKQRGQVAIPSNLHNLLVRYIDGQVCPVKSFVFKPWCIKGPYSDIKAVVELLGTRIDETIRGKFMRRRNRDGAFSLIFDSTIILPGAVALSKSALFMVNELQTHHTYSGLNKVCVGNSDPKKVFALSSGALGEQLSILNKFSPISHDIRFGTTRIVWPHWLERCSNFSITVESSNGQDQLDDSTPVAETTQQPAAEWRA